MDSAILVKDARTQSGLSIRELAKAANVAASTIFRIEKNDFNPSIETLQEILEATGRKLELRSKPDSWLNIIGLAVSIRKNIESNESEMIVRKTAEFVSHFEKQTKTRQHEMIKTRPPSTGIRKWDVFLAGICEWIANSNRIQTKNLWFMHPKYFLDHGIWITSLESMRAWEYAGTPTSLKVRGIYIHRENLVNI